ncbi:GFA family protein [Gallaecimonas kandeliae]|uniref:GFA family protein n=1 Tax=Gallaecimonas kandeliae TaxID=3029055 RepID=UPI0026494861|nr:GFA family protein [Gallaecimonas kandeliae]WKE66202.1 GFA family protein [Gallaecimonas kandeliae]
MKKPMLPKAAPRGKSQETRMTTQYQGRCHCGAVRFSLYCAPISQALQCNCSLCIRRNAIMSEPYFGPDAFQLLQGQEALHCYQWNDLVISNWFCRHCGIYVFHELVQKPGHVRLNLGCIEGLDPRALAIRHFDGATLI